MPSRTTRCETAVRRVRLVKAEEFFRAAREVRELADDETGGADAAVSLYVLAGIAAADVICCARLGEFAQGEDHRQAIALLKSADAESAPHLTVLLNFKTKAAYAHIGMGTNELTRSARAAGHLITTARRLSPRE